MTARTLLRLSRELHLTVGDSSTALTPREGLRFAERLIRTSMRRMIEEEVALSSGAKTASDRRSTP
jgi:hypothetical protein